MRDHLNKSLEILIWVATGFLVTMSCYLGAMIIRYGGSFGHNVEAIITGFMCIVFGATMSFVFAGICFQNMDVRKFTKHMALNLKILRR